MGPAATGGRQPAERWRARGYSPGYSAGTLMGTLRGTLRGALSGYPTGYLRGTQGVLKGYSRVLKGYSRGTHRVLLVAHGPCRPGRARRGSPALRPTPAGRRRRGCKQTNTPPRGAKTNQTIARNQSKRADGAETNEHTNTQTEAQTHRGDASPRGPKREKRAGDVYLGVRVSGRPSEHWRSGQSSARCHGGTGTAARGTPTNGRVRPSSAL
jgi:hypothetical protein